MLIKKISYVDYNGNQREDEVCFNFSKVELARMAANNEMVDTLKMIATEKDPQKIMATFERIIELSVGIKSEDGRSFVKDSTYTTTFMTSIAYDELMMELLQSGDAAAKFVSAIIPEIPDNKAISASAAK